MSFKNTEAKLNDELSALFESKVKSIYEDEDVLQERNIFTRTYDKMIAKLWPNSLGQPKLAAKVRLQAEGLYKSLLQRWIRYVLANKGNEAEVKTLGTLVKFLGGSSQVDNKILTDLAKVFMRDQATSMKDTLSDSQIRDFLYRTALYYMRYDDDFQDVLSSKREPDKEEPSQEPKRTKEDSDAHGEATDKVANYIKANLSRRQSTDLKDDFVLDVLNKAGVDPDAFMRRYTGRR